MRKLLVSVTLFIALMLTSCATNTEPAPGSAPEQESNAAALELGKSVFQANCSACHTTTSEDILVGPTMVGLASRAGATVGGLDARGYIEESILEPAAYLNEGFQNLMPATYTNSLGDEELKALVEYLLTFE